ncbi:MAG: hypothetical protein E7410_02355 [Ruminococcaceae bacterium]|nr:hypothetical protein [Oscillospiraceae bacterium]
MRTNGNLALQPAYKPQYQPKQADLRRKAEVMRAEKSRVKAKNVNVAVAIFYMAIIFAVAFCLVSREVSLYEKSSQINRLENRLEQAQSETKQAQIAAERVIDLNKLEEAAATKFAMSRPERTQTVYINIQKSDYVEKAAQRNVSVELAQNIQGSIKNLFGIFGVN